MSKTHTPSQALSQLGIGPQPGAEWAYGGVGQYLSRNTSWVGKPTST